MTHLSRLTDLSQVDLDVDFATEVEPYLGRLIGVGGFGRVYEAEWRGRKVAVKIMTCDTDAQWQVGGCGAGERELGACARPNGGARRRRSRS